MGWAKFIKFTEAKVRKRIALIKSFKIFGCSSVKLRKTLFYSYILQIFTWIYPIYPLLTIFLIFIILLSGDVYSVYNGIMISSPLPLMNFHLKTDV